MEVVCWGLGSMQLPGRDEQRRRLAEGLASTHTEPAKWIYRAAAQPCAAQSCREMPLAGAQRKDCDHHEVMWWPKPKPMAPVSQNKGSGNSAMLTSSCPRVVLLCFGGGTERPTVPARRVSCLVKSLSPVATTGHFSGWD